MSIGHDALCALIPHDGAMCLLEQVLAWDAQHIVCQARSHMDTANPLRGDGGLAALHGIEYAAQATAVHGGLLAQQRGERNPPGFLAAVRGVTLHCERLDGVAAPLRIEATELMRSGASFIYEFEVTAAGQRLLEGRLTVMAEEAQ
ncbi:MAG: hypothetical protein ACQETD_03155 [Pseudomonadota bacterium]